MQQQTSFCRMLGKTITVHRTKRETLGIVCKEYEAATGACCLKRDAKADGRLDVLLSVFREPGARSGEICCSLVDA